MRNFLLVCILFAAQFMFAGDASEKAAQEIMQADKAFNDLCQKKGMKYSFLYYADDKVIKLSNKEFATRNKAELEKWFGDDPITFQIMWKPLVAEASKSGDMGYSFGTAKFILADGTVRYGEYMTVWKRQSDGSWKFVMDGGNGTPDNPDLWK